MATLTTASPAGATPNDAANAAAAAGMAAQLVLGSALSLRGSGIFLPTGAALPVGVDASELVRGLQLDGDVVLYAARADLDLFGAGPSEGSSLSTWTSIQDESVTVPSASKVIGREMTDEFRARALSGLDYITDPIQLAVATSRGYDKTLTADLCTLAASADGSVGETGAAMTHDVFMDAVDATPNSDGQRRIMVLHPEQFKAWKRDLEQRSGMTQWRQANADMQMFRGEGFQGEYDGVEVWSVEAVTMDGDDYVGFICSAGSVILREDPQPAPGLGQLVLFDVVNEAGQAILRVSASRVEEAGKSRLILRVRCGMAFAHPDRVVRIISTGL